MLFHCVDRLLKYKICSYLCALCTCITKTIMTLLLHVLLFIFPSFIFYDVCAWVFKELSCVFNRSFVPTISKHRAVSIMHPCSFISILSYTLVAKVLPPESPSSVGISLNRFPFYRLSFCTFFMFLFPFLLLILAHTLNLRTIALSLSDFILGYSYFL